MIGIPSYDLDAMRAHESEHAGLGLMERAGTAAAEWLLDFDKKFHTVLVVAGPGNNGGDAFVMARKLVEAGKSVLTVPLAQAGSMPTDAQAAHEALFQAGGRFSSDMPMPPYQADWVVDGLFGIGLNRPPNEGFAAVIHGINRFRSANSRILSLDVPSGVDALTGDVYDAAVLADVTLTFIAHKTGLWTGAALDQVGHLVMLDCDAPSPSPGADASIVKWSHLAPHLPIRARNAHKGSAGTLSIVGGAQGMVGAALLAGRAGIRAGAGKVRIALLADEPPTYDSVFPELMLASFDGTPPAGDALVIGPGLSTVARARDGLGRALNMAMPIVLDADALNIIAGDFGMRDRVRARSVGTIMTPHPGEAARLLNTDVKNVNADRVDAARELAKSLKCCVALKGAGTVIVSDQGATMVNATGNPLLATAGTGDVLAGIIGALLAQGLAPLQALVMGVGWHGHLADSLAARGVKRATATDIVEQIPFTV